jgi:hypothetical protein
MEDAKGATLQGYSKLYVHAKRLHTVTSLAEAKMNIIT